jgi:AbrB family looped-hinge helix DNA binding protein
METVSVSTKYQVVIPRATRKQLHIEPGQKMQVIGYDNRVVFVPIRPSKRRAVRCAVIDTTIAA